MLVHTPVYSEGTILKGSILYNVESARKLAFEGLDLKLDKTTFSDKLIDENNKENREALKSGKKLDGRYLMSFSMAKGFIKGYALVYENKPEYTYYYSTSGYLVAIDVDNKPSQNTFPYKVGKYSAVTGNLVSIGLYISEDEQYVYTKDGKLKAHWIGDIGYNAKGRPIATRY